MFDEHWAFIVHATLAPAGTQTPGTGQCVWSEPDARGLQINGDEAMPLAIDMRVYSEHFPFDRMTLLSGGRVLFDNRTGARGDLENAARGADDAFKSIRAGNGMFDLVVRVTEHTAPEGGIIVEHVGNDNWSFREPPTTRPYGPD